MKPSPRQRIRPNRYGLKLEHRRKQGQQQRTSVWRWSRVEQRRLMSALDRLRRRPGGGTVDVDYGYLHKWLRQRPIAQIRSVVEVLVARAVSTVANHLRWQRQAEEQMGERQGEEQRPLELWRDMASFVAGPREDAISTAFSQMLVVSSTEPRTLRNTTHAPPPPGPAQPTTTTTSVTPGRLPPNNVSKEAPPAGSQLGATVSPPTPAQGTSAMPPAKPTQASGVAADPVDGAGGARWRSQRSKFTVDFQKIYLYLAGVGRRQRDCILTHMECAVVLDLLMTLPEELPLLDSPELRQHMSKTYFSLSAPAPTPPGEANGSGAASDTDGRATDPHATDNRATDNHATGIHAMDHRATAQTRVPESGLCPLNPFMVPLKLLVKRT